MRGECDQNAKYMLEACATACTRCARWAAKGECSANAAYMNVSCADECACEARVARGGCEHNVTAVECADECAQEQAKREVEAAWDAVLVGWEAPPRVPIRLFTPTLLHTNASILTARPKTQTAHLTTTAATTHGFLSAADFLVIRPDQHDGSDQNSFR